MEAQLNDQASGTSRGYGWVLVFLSLPAAMAGVRLLVSPNGWWVYATAAIAFALAVVLLCYGVKAIAGRNQS